MKVQGARLPTIEGERVSLRWLNEADADAVFEIFRDPEVVRYWSSPAMKSAGEAHELISSVHRHFAEHELYQWGVALNRDDRVIGTLTLHRLDWSSRRAEIGFSLGRSCWGQGYMTECATLGLDHAFGALELRRIEADVDPRNESSLRLLERLGFTREGLARERWEVAGEVQDSLLLGLLAREWRREDRPAASVDRDEASADTH